MTDHGSVQRQRARRLGRAAGRRVRAGVLPAHQADRIGARVLVRQGGHSQANLRRNTRRAAAGVECDPLSASRLGDIPRDRCLLSCRPRHARTERRQAVIRAGGDRPPDRKACNVHRVAATERHADRSRREHRRRRARVSRRGARPSGPASGRSPRADTGRRWAGCQGPHRRIPALVATHRWRVGAE